MFINFCLKRPSTLPVHHPWNNRKHCWGFNSSTYSTKSCQLKQVYQTSGMHNIDKNICCAFAKEKHFLVKKTWYWTSISESKTSVLVLLLKAKIVASGRKKNLENSCNIRELFQSLSKCTLSACLEKINFRKYSLLFWKFSWKANKKKSDYL